MEVLEGQVGQFANGVQADAGEDSVTDLVETDSHGSGDIVRDHQHDWRNEDWRQPVWQNTVVSQGIGCPCIKVGCENGNNFCDNQRREGQNDTLFQLRPCIRPHVNPESFQ